MSYIEENSIEILFNAIIKCKKNNDWLDINTFLNRYSKDQQKEAIKMEVEYILKQLE